MKHTLTILSTLYLVTFARSEPPSSGYGAPQGGSSYGPPKGGDEYKHELHYIKDNFNMHPIILKDANNNFFQICLMKVLRKRKKKPSKFDFAKKYFSKDDLNRPKLIGQNDEFGETHLIKYDYEKPLLEDAKFESKIKGKSRIRKRRKATPYSWPNPYEFGYRVKDDYSGSKFHQQEASDGNQVRGEYRVELPDGRTQIVTYWADWQTGFHADVKYEGKATYPPNPPKYGPPKGGGNGNGGYNYPAPSAPGTSYGAP